jgi:signal transduction histidine kinase
MKAVLNWLYRFCLSENDLLDKEKSRRVQAFIYVWISTTIIMWFYVWFSYFIYDFPTVGHFGIVYTIIHTLTPLFYRLTRSLIVAGISISLTALMFQITFALFNGGIHSPSVIWFTAHPVIMSFFGSRRLIYFSIVLNILVVGSITWLGRNGFLPLDALLPLHSEIMMISSLIGLDIVIATYTIVFIFVTKQGEKELAQRNQLIENLVRIISHDSNNALFVSLLNTQNLQNIIKNLPQISEEDKANINKRLDKIHLSNKQIESINSSILEWMKATDRQDKLALEKINFEDLGQFMTAAFFDKLQLKSINLKIDFDNVVNKSILANKTSFYNQIISNLMNNAIKFSPSNSEIHFYTEVRNDRVYLNIRDNGIGIPKDMMANLFNPAYCISRSGTNGEKGTGYGLSIVKTMLEKMNGEILVESQTADYNQASFTKMTIILPLA